MKILGLFIVVFATAAILELIGGGSETSKTVGIAIASGSYVLMQIPKTQPQGYKDKYEPSY